MYYPFFYCFQKMIFFVVVATHFLLKLLQHLENLPSLQYLCLLDTYMDRPHHRCHYHQTVLNFHLTILAIQLWYFSLQPISFSWLHLPFISIPISQLLLLVEHLDIFFNFSLCDKWNLKHVIPPFFMTKSQKLHWNLKHCFSILPCKIFQATASISTNTSIVHS